MSSLRYHDPFLHYAAALPGSRKISAAAWLVVILAHLLTFALLIYSRAITTPPQLPESLMVEVLDSNTPKQVQIQPVQPATPEPTKPISKPVKNVTPTPVLASQSQAPAVMAPQPTPIAAPQPTPQTVTATPSTNSMTNTAAAPATTAPSFDAAYLDNPAPKYPTISKRMGEQGVVKLRVFVESNGKPSKIELFKSSNTSRLDQAAIDAVWQWKFVPAKRGNESIADWVIVPIVFSLNKE